MIRGLVLVAALLAASVVVGLCFFVPPAVGHSAGWLLPAGLASLTVLAAVAAATMPHAYRHHRFSRHLATIAQPATVVGLRIHELPQTATAFVAGLRRPEIFMSRSLTTDLDADELEAVLRHERYHQLDRAPAKLVLLEGLASFLRPIPGCRAWLARRAAELEIAADRYAIHEGSSRGALARALLKLGPGHGVSYGIGFATADELRVRALLGAEQSMRRRPQLHWLLGSAAVIGICLVLLP